MDQFRAYDRPIFMATNATRPISTTTAITPVHTPALNMAPIASHPDVMVAMTTVRRAGTIRRPEIDVLMATLIDVNENRKSRKLRLFLVGYFVTLDDACFGCFVVPVLDSDINSRAIWVNRLSATSSSASDLFSSSATAGNPAWPAIVRAVP